MKIANSLVCLFTLLVLVAPASMSHAQDDRAYGSLMVSRDADGSINRESRKAIRQLSRIANQHGHVRVWVTLDTPFDPFLAERSEQVASEQQERIDELFDQVLGQLLAGRQVRYPTGERIYAGASIMLMVTDAGLSRLVDDTRVGQLVGIRE